MNRILLLAFLAIPYLTQSQNSSAKSEIKGVIDQMFDAMRANDSLMIKPLFAPGASLTSIYVDKENQVIKKSSPVSDFITAVGRPHKFVWDEQIWSYDINVDHPMAVAWTEYTFYAGDRLSHCGVNVFQLIKTTESWKISDITDTRRNTGCKTKTTKEVDQIMDAWHMAAATADEDIFFGSMTSDAVYIGTDPSERWLRDELREWSKVYFDKESAWAFTPKSRQIAFSQDESIAWFDELLDTWMGDCRGSGVMVKTDDGWKLKHYHLSIAVPNDVTPDYLKLIGKERPSTNE